MDAMDIWTYSSNASDRLDWAEQQIGWLKVENKRGVVGGGKSNTLTEIVGVIGDGIVHNSMAEALR